MGTWAKVHSRVQKHLGVGRGGTGGCICQAGRSSRNRGQDSNRQDPVAFT